MLIAWLGLGVHWLLVACNRLAISWLIDLLLTCSVVWGLGISSLLRRWVDRVLLVDRILLVDKGFLTGWHINLSSTSIVRSLICKCAKDRGEVCSDQDPKDLLTEILRLDVSLTLVLITISDVVD